MPAVLRYAPAALLVSLLALTACAPSSGLAGTDEESESSEHLLQVRPGDTVPIGAARVIAPERSRGVFAEVLLETGESQVLHLFTSEEGRVFERALVADAETAGQGDASMAGAGERTNASAPKPCGDDGQAPLPYRLGARLDWRFHAGSTPAANSVDAVEAALQRAAVNIARADNSCGLSDEVGIGQHYLGRTAVATQMDADATCKASGNGINSIGFGALPKGVLGLACVFYGADGVVTEADVRLNKASAWFAGSAVPSGCAGRFSVEGVATHELGHVFGLGHVAEDTHGNLTMSPLINGPCQISEATLGLGDVLALSSKY